MNVADFTYLLNKPEKVTEENIDSIKKIIEEYPFFQPAKAVYLKALKNQDSFKYNNALKHTAAYTTDRSILFEFITSKTFYQNKIAEIITKQISELYDIEVNAQEVLAEEKIEKVAEEQKALDHKVISQTPSDKKEIVTEAKSVTTEAKVTVKTPPITSFDFDNVNSEAVMDPYLFQPKPTIKNYSFLKLKPTEDQVKNVKEPALEDKTPEIKPETAQVNPDTATVKPEKTEVKLKKVEAKSKKAEIKPETKLEIGKPLDFNQGEKHSFSEWLKLSAMKPISREPVEKIQPEKKSEIKPPINSSIDNKFKLIEQFIEKKPKIIPAAEKTPKHNLAKERTVEKSELMTETLARVYLEQKKFKKAIQAYKILSLKYPEKSSFFADQIEAVKELQQK